LTGIAVLLGVLIAIGFSAFFTLPAQASKLSLSAAVFLIATGVLLMLGAGLVILVNAFRESVWWGLGFFLPAVGGLVSLAFVIKHWRQNGVLFLVNLGGAMVSLVGFAWGGSTILQDLIAGSKVATTPEQAWVGFYEAAKAKDATALFNYLTPESQEFLIAANLMEISMKRTFMGRNTAPDEDEKRVMAVLQKYGISIEPGKSRADQIAKVSDKAAFFQELMTAKEGNYELDMGASDLPTGAVTGIAIQGDMATGKLDGEDIHFKRVDDAWLVDLLGGMNLSLASGEMSSAKPTGLNGGDDRLTCLNHLKSLGLAFRMWAMDHGNQFPFNVPIRKGGSQEYCQRKADGFDANSFRHFQAMGLAGQDLASGRYLVCPADTSKKSLLLRANEWNRLKSSDVTYQVRSGSYLTPSKANQILARCPIHNHTLYCDGQVKRQ